jgi:hypothetical protein
MNFIKACLKTASLQKAYKYKGWAAVAALFFLATACDKPKTFTLKSTPPATHFDLKDTILPVFLETERLDSLRSNNLSRDLIGSLQDPELGGTDANLYFQLRLQSLSPNFKNAKLDGAVLSLAYSGITDYTGDPSTIQKWNIFPLADGLDNSIPYYTNAIIKPDLANAAGNFTGKFSPKDSVLKININNGYASKILTASSSTLGDDPSFQSIFKGLAILPDHNALNGGTGAIVHFNLLDVRSKLSIYYHDSTGKADTFNLIITDGDVRVNTYTHSYRNNVTSSLDKAGQDKAYLQALGGLKVKVSLPDSSMRKFMINGTTAINQAELVFPELSSPPASFIEPITLYLYPRDASGGNENTNAEFNQSFIDQTFVEYGGGWRPGEKTYSFVLTRHIQNVLDRYRKNQAYRTYQGLNLFIPGDNPMSSGRIILNNFNSKNPVKNGPYLRLIYTKIAEK